MKTTKTNPAKLLLRYLWPRMQRGERHFIIDNLSPSQAQAILAALNGALEAAQELKEM